VRTRCLTPEHHDSNAVAPGLCDVTESAEPTSVLVADDDRRIRAALAELLANEPDFVLAAEAADGKEALELARMHEAALILVDVQMPQGGPALVRALRALPHRPVVVGLSGRSDAGTWTSMLAAGASGYLLKGALAADLPSLLRRCAGGELIVTVPGAAAVLRRLLVTPR
jgi:two-component system invasion response regulator UvrY